MNYAVLSTRFTRGRSIGTGVTTDCIIVITVVVHDAIYKWWIQHARRVYSNYSEKYKSMRRQVRSPGISRHERATTVS